MRSLRYRNRKLEQLDSCFFAHAEKEETGLEYDILIDSQGNRKRRGGRPRVGVVVGNVVVPVSISSDPIILSGKGFPGFAPILKWVLKYKEPLLAHWNGELTDREILNVVSVSLNNK